MLIKYIYITYRYRQSDFTLDFRDANDSVTYDAAAPMFCGLRFVCGISMYRTAMRAVKSVVSSVLGSTG